MALGDPFDADSVAALIVTSDGRYLLQLRDDRPGVDLPGMWGLFGGSSESGEEPECALRRELAEELDFTPKLVTLFCSLTIDERPYGGWYFRRTFYEVGVTEEQILNFSLREGQAMALYTGADVAGLGTSGLPFDLCAVLMHVRREESRRTRAERARRRER